jgi:hypothetical protein
MGVLGFFPTSQILAVGSLHSFGFLALQKLTGVVARRLSIGTWWPVEHCIEQKWGTGKMGSYKTGFSAVGGVQDVSWT